MQNKWKINHWLWEVSRIETPSSLFSYKTSIYFEIVFFFINQIMLSKMQFYWNSPNLTYIINRLDHDLVCVICIPIYSSVLFTFHYSYETPIFKYYLAFFLLFGSYLSLDLKMEFFPVLKVNMTRTHNQTWRSERWYHWECHQP